MYAIRSYYAEIVELAEVLNKMGARIEGAGTDTIRIIGVDELQPFLHDVMPRNNFV